MKLSEGRCEAAVYERDTLRYSGRGRNGFEMHYRKRHCRRVAKYNGYCWQHAWYHPEGRAAFQEMEGE